MRFEPGFVTTLREQIYSLPDDVRSRMNRTGGLSDENLLTLVARPDTQDVLDVEVAKITDVVRYDPAIAALGKNVLDNEQVAYCLLAGGVGTRVGCAKALLKFNNGLSLLAMKLAQSYCAAPTIIMINPATKREIVQHVEELAIPNLSIGAFEQYEGYRLTPDNQLSYVNSEVEFAPMGHGDLALAMLESGVLVSLRKRNVKYVVVSNVDNMMSSIDPILLGHHVASHRSLTFLSVERNESDGGGVVAWVDGRLRVIENFQLPDSFDIKTAKLQNTNTFVVDLDVLEDAANMSWRWHRIRKVIGGRLIVQYERLINQLTECYDATFVLAPREQHYLPIKTTLDLERAEQLLFSKW